MPNSVSAFRRRLTPNQNAVIASPAATTNTATIHTDMNQLQQARAVGKDNASAGNFRTQRHC